MLDQLKPKSEFSRNVLTLMTGTTIAQAIPIAISPILTRIYTPEDFGMFALYMSIASLLSVVATGRYELAIMLPKKDEDAVNIVALSILISFFISFIALSLVFFFNTQITNLLGTPEISSWLYFIPITVLLTGIYQSFNYWSNRQKEYKRLATSRVIQSGTTATTNLGMGFGGFGSSGLILGGIVGQGVATFFLGSRIYNEIKIYFSRIRKLKIFALIRKHKKLPIYNLPNAFIDSVRVAGINILIAKFFSSATLGQFSLAWKMVQLPMGIIGSSLSQVFFQKISNAKREDLYRIVTVFMKKSFFIATPFFLFLYIFAPDLFAFVFGKNWRLAGEVTSVLTPWLLLNFVTMPLANIFIILNKQEIILYISIVYMVAPLLLLYLCRESDFIYTLEVLVIAMSLILMSYILFVIYFLKREEKNVI